jgi:secondary thiamine-phosphate synthase enzyme|tara:strand:- start:1897 stop:2316 length:420 start_codon:yes stop_codon:yes gene_type:complete
MKIITKKIDVDCKADVDLKDITNQVVKVLRNSNIRDGIVTVFVPGATGAVSTIEFEPGLLKDMPTALERIAPTNIEYSHHETWGCDNGKSHIRATFIGPSLVVPFADGNLILGTYQQIVFINLDTKSRRRTIILQFMGE